ncbi:MAG: Multifunctional-autoprocessing repeats-in-toxin [Chlamydiae bacterium]|nr:Multifunctional-autoprocessing repeats-in-toxin [Chlamydiota bacterium]
MAAIIETATPFQAQWPKRHDPALKSLISKVGRVFWNIISVVIFPIGLVRLAGYYLRNLSLRCIIPGTPHLDAPIRSYWDIAKIITRLLFNPENFKADLTKEGEYRLKEHGGEPVKLTAPDGAHLDGAFFPDKHRKKVILFAGGNVEQWETQIGLDILKPLGASILFINPRGVGKSSGQRYEDGYALDTYTACEYLIHKQGIDPEDIVFTGFSMGGANTTRGASLIQEKHPDKKISISNINSFANLHLEVQAFLKNKGFFAAIVRIGTRFLNFDMDVKKDWDTLQGEKYIFYNPNDPVIPLPAQLATAVKKEPIGKSHLIELHAFRDHIPFKREDELNAFYDVMRKLLQIQPSWWDWMKFKSPPTLEKRTIAQVA